VGNVRYRVVVADDYPETANITCMLLTLMGHECQAATTGEEAIAHCQHAAPDLVILDIGMPKLSGYEVARELRRLHGRSIYLVAMTGWGQPEDHARALDAGFDRFLVKPIDAATIADVLATADAFIAATAAARVIPPPRSSGEPAPGR
jgi:CheY-like chemotaxis protein